MVANSARDAAAFAAAPGGTIVARANSAYYYDSAAFCGPVRRVGARFSVVVQMDPKIAAAIAAIG